MFWSLEVNEEKLKNSTYFLNCENFRWFWKNSKIYSSTHRPRIFQSFTFSYCRTRNLSFHLPSIAIFSSVSSIVTQKLGCIVSYKVQECFYVRVPRFIQFKFEPDLDEWKYIEQVLIPANKVGKKEKKDCSCTEGRTWKTFLWHNWFTCSMLKHVLQNVTSSMVVTGEPWCPCACHLLPYVWRNHSSSESPPPLTVGKLPRGIFSTC